jgi:hypothetical protein
MLLNRRRGVPQASRTRLMVRDMSYTLTLQCGCVLYVASHPKSLIAHTRVIESKGGGCRVRRHEIGFRLHLWEILPDPNYWPQPDPIRLPTNRSGRA